MTDKVYPMKKVQSLYWLLLLSSLTSGTKIEADYSRKERAFKDWRFPFQTKRWCIPLTTNERLELLARTYWLLCQKSSRAESALKKALQKFASISSKRDFCQKHYSYPWFDLEKECAERGIKTLPLLQYGSLMYPSEKQCGMESERAFGFCVKRIFNYVMMHPERSSLGLPNERYLREMAQLNVEYTGRVGDVIEGIVRATPIEDLPYLRYREKGYDLIKIPVLYHADLDNPEIHIKYVYVLSAPSDSAYVRCAHCLKPNINYLNLCVESLYFYDCSLEWFFNATMLADTITCLSTWFLKQLVSVF